MEVQSLSGEAVELNDAVFGAPFNEALIHEVVVAYLSSGRTGDKGQKTRSEVSGGGKKPWRQKGTGRARAGTIRSPIWVGGGRAFAARPGERNYEKKVNRKAYRVAMRSILSELIRQERLVVVDKELSGDKPSTKALVAGLKGVGVSEGLLLSEAVDKNLYLSARNIPNLDVCDISAVDPVSLVRADKVVCTAAALKQLEQRLAS